MTDAADRRPPPPRAHILYGPLGTLEVIIGRQIPAAGHQVGRLSETMVVDYGGNEWGMARTDIHVVEDESHVYRVQRFPGIRGEASWYVAGTRESIAACPMNGAARYLGTRDQAEKWVDRLNKRFWVDTSERTPDW